VADSGGQITTARASVTAARHWAAWAYGRWRDQREAARPADVLPVPELRRLGLSGLLFRALRDADDARADNFKAEYRHAATANLIRLSHADAFCRALETAGIVPVLIKGASFLARVPDDLGVRAMADVDVLVAAADCARAAEQLRASGYHLHGDYGDRIRRTVPALDYIKDGGPCAVEIDLHRGLAQAPMLPDLPSAVLANHQVCGTWRVPAPPEAFCITAVHRARHGYVWSGLDLVDLKWTADGADDQTWNAIVRAAECHGVAGAAYAAFRQAIWWLGEREADAARLAELGRLVSPLRRYALERMAEPAAVLEANPMWARPLMRMLVVHPCSISSPWRSVAAAAVHLPRRAMDDWDRSRGAGLGERLGHIARLASRGSRDIRRVQQG